MPTFTKMNKKQIIKTLEVPQDIEVYLNGSEVKVKHQNKEIIRNFKNQGLSIAKNENKIEIKSDKANRMHAKMVGSIVAHIKNMIRGVKEDYIYKLEICNVHFPMTVKVDGNRLIIKNFLGENIDRHAEISKDTKVAIKGNEILVTSFNKESAGQTAANIEKSTLIKYRDRRVFQDGIFLTERNGKRI